MGYAFGTDIGKVRSKNEDAAAIVTNNRGDIFMMVFDGMGGHNLGDVASTKAKEYLCECFKQKKRFSTKFSMKSWLRKTIKKANSYLNTLALQYPQCRGMGSTFACYLIHKNKVLMGYLGDTRAYVIYDGGISQYSIDETYVQFLYDSGKIKREDMETHPSKHIVTNALGCYEKAIINTVFIDQPYDALLLCSDGLYNLIDEFRICSIIEQDKDEDLIVRQLIKEANANGGKDNIAIAIYKKRRAKNDKKW